ncbi:MAG: ABC transporter ATP-binding protein [Bacilli bacterium]|nr:ABC transporter ATP-binding protein [Bacilli bacterium]
MKETLKNFKRVYSYAREYRKNFIIFTLISVLFVAFNIVTPIIGAKMIVALTDNLYFDLFLMALIMFVLNMVCVAFDVVLRRNTQKFFRGTSKNIEIDAANSILKIELSNIDNNNSGTFIQRLTSDPNELGHVFTRTIGFLTGILTNIGTFVAVFIINKPVFIYYFTCSTIITILFIIRSKKVNEKDKIFRKQREKTSGLIGELVRGIRDIKMLNAKDSFMDEINKSIDDYTGTEFDFRNTESFFRAVIDTIYYLSQFGLIMILIYLLKNGYIVTSIALVLYNYENRILGNFLNNVGDMITMLKSFNLSCERVFSLSTDKFKKEQFGNECLDKINGNIEFKDVHFSYDEKEVLKGLNFKIKANETVGFVGKSGVGKTTIFSLLCKLYNVDDNQIFIDGKDINTLDEKSIRNNITIISQNPYIFNMSIKDNLRLVKKGVTDEEIEEACKLACLDEFINALPDKYDSVVGEGGVTLSGGQRQRLAIARAFIQDTEIILFDEATSSLDNETQALIQEAINNLKQKYTILIVAHRLSTIINSDRIIVIDDGVNAGEGKHRTLLKNNKVYKKLYEAEIKEK